MAESVAILLIFFVFIVFGFVFYMNIIKGSTKVEIEENIQLKAISVAQKASFLPELQCSNENVRVENCIDLYKLDAISSLLKENNIYYYDIFEFSKIWVEEISSESNRKWPLYNHTSEDYKNKLSTFVPISLLNPTSKKYNFGILIVEAYTK